MKLKKILYWCYSYVIITLVILLLGSCFRNSNDNYPYHRVYEGRELFIIYKCEIIKNSPYGNFKYAVTDASGKGWTYISFEKFQVGDTLHLIK